MADVFQHLGGDSTGAVTDADRVALLPSLSLLQICSSMAVDQFPFGTLLTGRPRLRIEYNQRPFKIIEISPDKLKTAIEEVGQHDEPGIFLSYPFLPKWANVL